MELFQHALVTLAALAAASIIVRRVFTAGAPGNGTAQCASCPVAQGKSGPSAAANAEPSETTHPMILVKHHQP